ncbi:hypothetical protein B7L66_25290 (plasmid) [Xanthomonas citri pv. citri]|uniref:Uncharacterized protein n=1 Tax=Xanthomonas axonopodis pv. citri (strain 306) TaxID=190486 RepID=A0AAI7ZJH6_XANAC|nr:hypothetical protein XACb0063 [Xanthomonas citri pv. citri str. 306]AGI10548.1 hypothetical protein XCAW_b00028 [Xanthomonas citri subsp. citri Aw12879]ARR15469.1 hypothetical protein B7L66_25290 [Xanthomonas citri pv. citri]ASY91120.1 hypothetical protein CIW72_22675 [Xanthomonas citri pv. malvacearum]QYF47386.1 hypothetical protein HZS93_06070 [Xanthomonas citri]
MRRTRQVGRIARGLVEVVCGYPCVRLPMPMSQNMRNRCSGWPLLQSRRGRDRKRSPAWGAAHRCRVPRHRQSALILAPARSACRSKTAPPPARRFPTGAAMTSVARANGRHAENCLGHRSSSPGPRSCRQLHRRRCRRPGARSEGRQCVVRNP